LPQTSVPKTTPYFHRRPKAPLTLVLTFARVLFAWDGSGHVPKHLLMGISEPAI